MINGGKEDVHYSRVEGDEDEAIGKDSRSISESSTARGVEMERSLEGSLGKLQPVAPSKELDVLDFRQTAWLGFEFSFLWVSIISIGGVTKADALQFLVRFTNCGTLVLSHHI